MTSLHYSNERAQREYIIKNFCDGDGIVLDNFFVEHPKGLELVQVTNHAIIVYYNFQTGKLVTKKIARAIQIEKLYADNHKKANNAILAIAKEHEIKGYNNI